MQGGGYHAGGGGGLRVRSAGFVTDLQSFLGPQNARASPLFELLMRNRKIGLCRHVLLWLQAWVCYGHFRIHSFLRSTSLTLLTP